MLALKESLQALPTQSLPCSLFALDDFFSSIFPAAEPVHRLCKMYALNTLKSLALATSKSAGNIDWNVLSLAITGFLKNVSQRVFVR